MHPILACAATFITDQFGRLLGVIKRYPARAILAVPAALFLHVLVLAAFTPGIGDLRKAKSQVPSVLLTADNTKLAEYKRVNRQWVDLKNIAPHVVDALIATEDHRFYEHHGIDFRRTAGALISTL
jgi:penicillin-binding protein 1A